MSRQRELVPSSAYYSAAAGIFRVHSKVPKIAYKKSFHKNDPLRARGIFKERAFCCAEEMVESSSWLPFRRNTSEIEATC